MMANAGYVRTLEDFVEDLASDGHGLKYIRTVALATRWRGLRGEIEILYKNLKKRLNKVQQTLRDG